MSWAMGEGGSSAVAELQGLDGAFSFAERLLQRIWRDGEFDQAQARTADGRTVRILYPGKWNGLGGPDFLNARLEIDGLPLTGDVELHLRASDWQAHGHASDPHYRKVILHVVLFPPMTERTPCADGRTLPILALLPLLLRSLEEYADDDAVERLARHAFARASEALLALTVDQRLAELRRCATERWRAKLGFAARRVERLGWDAACHQSALEILGYRFNRGPMLALAAEHPLEEWLVPDPGGRRPESWFQDYAGRWNRQAVRPANHPLRRLKQYAGWIVATGFWPARLAQVAADLPGKVVADPADARVARRSAAFRGFQDGLSAQVCGGAVGGTRFHTLACDGLLPLAGARFPEKAEVLGQIWFAWTPGDLPETVFRWLAEMGLSGRARPGLCQGLAQGLLGWIWREEEQLQQTRACRCGRGT